MSERIDEILQALLEDDTDDSYKDVYGEPPRQPKRLPLGTVSHGTCRREDVAPRIFAELRSVDPQKADELEKEYEDLKRVNDDPDIVDDILDEFVFQGLFDEMAEYCPPYTYFGANEGDGSDYGVWINTDQISEDLEGNEEELKEINRGDPLPGDSTYVVVKSPHGYWEALLNGQNGREIWSV